MPSPTIGVTSPLTHNQEPSSNMEVMHHFRILERFGARPVILRMDLSPLHVIDDFALHGIVFTGGGDICMSRYGGTEARIVDRLDPQRDTFEFALMERALQLDIPILAVCRGMQIVNVLLGGTLIEDLPQHFGASYNVLHHQIRELQREPDEYSHTVAVIPGTRFHAITENLCFEVNSVHHQSIRKLAPGLRVSAVAEDGVIEAVEFAGADDTNVSPASRSSFVGVQWHPEQLYNDRVTRTIYKHFIEACMQSGFRGFQDVKGVPT